LIIATRKLLLACLQMATSAGSTQVCHGIAVVDVAIFLPGSLVGRALDLQAGGRGIDPRPG